MLIMEDMGIIDFALGDIVVLDIEEHGWRKMSDDDVVNGLVIDILSTPTGVYYKVFTGDETFDCEWWSYGEMKKVK